MSGIEWEWNSLFGFDLCVLNENPLIWIEMGWWTVECSMSWEWKRIAQYF